MKEKLQSIVDSRFGQTADKFYNSVWYIIAIGIICIIAHSFNIPITGAAILTVLLVPSLIFCKNSFVLVPIMCMAGFVLSYETKPNRGYFNDAWKISILCVLAVIIITAIVFNLVYYRKWRLMFKKAYLSISIAILSGALLVGGIGAPLFSPMGVLMALAISIVLFLPYSFLLNCGEYSGRKTIEYFAWTMIVMATVIFAAVFLQYIRNDFDMTAPKNFLELGYAISNSAAAIVLITMPITFYMIYVYKHGYLFFIAIAMELATIMLTFSRASIVIALPGTLITAIGLCFKKKKGRIGYYIACGIMCAIAIAIMVYYREYIFGEINKFLTGVGTGSGRTPIWKEGFEEWKKTPIFGIGVWYLPQVNTGHYYHSYHCTPLTYLYCNGIVGLAAYLYHRYKTVRLTFSAKLTAERIFAAMSVLVLLLNSLLDIYMSEPLHLVYYSILLALIECDVNRTKSESVLQQAVIETEPNGDNSMDVKDGPIENKILKEGE